jgi:hypothetical protein
MTMLPAEPARSNYSEIPNSSNGWKRKVNHGPQGKHGRGKRNEVVFRAVRILRG